ncbi:hypothetical protein [Bacillus sp. B1-b2]|uniref:hypothetical protein n=1 Tax=Bacillus sp. B1-b2 TaxID=2653201 RepID=UPI0012621E5D|nr:hypothetical protein [Bacillus sp. B1-b2]KAB7672484.1 hypothetical protein F9279_02325 [Bacillus sp. B1-b2]
MTLEKKLIEKTYYESYTKDRDELPFEVLGQLYMQEQRKNVPDMTSIRFAQGELYFQYHDYEAAIFKWENISGELEPWAKKNLADAYLELEEYSTAESFYKSIATDSDLLTTEISLQLFSLYLQKGNHEMALDMIKSLVISNPDYANITTIAKKYYEEQQEWDEAIQLAVHEGLRTDSLKWYDALIPYSKLELIKNYPPSYFKETLQNVQELDRPTFTRLVVAMWPNYQETTHNLAWVQLFNEIFVPSEEEENSLAEVIEKSYHYLISGKYPINEVKEFIPSLLANYFLSAVDEKKHTAASAVLAWNEMFKESIDRSVVEQAETNINLASNSDVGTEEFMSLFQSIVTWANKHDIHIDHKFSRKVMEYIPSQNNHILMLGSTGSGVNTYINELIGETILAEETKAVVTIQDQDYLEMKELTDSGFVTMDNLTNFYDELLNIHDYTENPRVFNLYAPSSYLRENKWTVSTAPFVSEDSYCDYALLADSLLFVINEKAVFSYTEYEQLNQWKEKSPHLTIQFLIYVDDVDHDRVATKRLQKAISTIQHYFSDSKIFIYSKQENPHSQLDEISLYYTQHFQERDVKEERLSKSTTIIQDLITSLLDKRVEMESSLQTSLQVYEEMVSKLSGAKNQLIDMEAMQSDLVIKQFHDLKRNIKEEIIKEVPELLRNCKELVKEDSDFSKIHLILNEEMNKRINSYLQETMVPRVHQHTEDWIQHSQTELEKSQIFLNELKESFNDIYQEQTLTLTCDFSIIDDWHRDARRLTGGMQVDQLNIFMRFNPSQMFLKSAGKLLGVMQQNKKMLQSKYQKYMETEDFQEVANEVAEKVLQQFDFYEKGLARDIQLFYVQPIQTLQTTVEVKTTEIEEYRDLLSRLKKNPAMFHDPLRLFELRLLQYDWLANTVKVTTTTW